MESVFPLPLSRLLFVSVQMPLGWLATIFGTALLLWAMLTFAMRKTAIYPNQPAQELVVHGPYRISRNSMNVALTAVSASVALLADNFWMLLLLPLVLFTLTSLVIRREEKHLAEAFGQSYLDYKTRVRRWL
ncbi:MAG: isoprenylcysteine carboxylmethyltransferase family protein [Fuerstiella sp.]